MITHMKSIFSRHEIPQIVMSDGGNFSPVVNYLRCGASSVLDRVHTTLDQTD